MRLEMPAFQNARVLVAGDVMLDRYWHGRAARISPEAPVPVVKVSSTEDRPGGAANVALNIAALGASASVAGIVGEDEAGVELDRKLAAAGVRSCLQHCPQSSTIIKLRVISQQQQLLRVDFEDCFAQDAVIQLSRQILRELEHAAVLVLSDYGKGSLEQAQHMIQAARSKAIPVIVDPKGTDFGRYRGASVLTPNLAEFEAVVGNCSNEDELIARGVQLLGALELQALLITRGEAGMTLLQAADQVTHLPAQAREVFDVTGAGDTVVAVLASALAAGQSLRSAVSLANIAAGLAVARLGTAAVSARELRRALQQMQGSGRGMLNTEQLIMAVSDARQQGESIVFTNGCFDIIHAGHVSYLAEARKQGDRLIVAVNDDQSVRRLKGSSRPINTVEHRMAVLAGLEAVDWVVSFAEDTPETLLALLRPEVLVKGGDYSEAQVVGAEFVRSYGGDVRVLAFVDDCSTSAIVEKILRT
jgi:D-beta-D-heptose 7-phosphate kinase / D-beta-D-heptose 1-phosphate adenosyltransferase